ncbi:carbonic anhydrase [Desulfosporosinus fructosivorans]
MDYLKAGLIKFRTQDYEEHKNLFCRLKRHQEPHTLFITCSDSRVVPQLITKSLPGELFVVRNIANIIPKYQESHECDSWTSATTSAIEYAVKILKVKSIIICGHSNCGGCSAIHLPDKVLDEIPATKKWLELSENVKTRVMDEMKATGKTKDLDYREWLTEQMNIVEQIKHLLTYPYVVERLNRKELEIIGMYYTIETGEVFIYDSHKGSFELAN